jgi:hypothetical protein
MWPYPCIIGRDRNVVVVDFAGKPEPPAPQFPGANGLREAAGAVLRPALGTDRRFHRLTRKWSCGSVCSEAAGAAAPGAGVTPGHGLALLN